MAIARFQTGSIEHQLLLGLTLAHQTISYKTSRGDLAPINIVNPVYGAQPKNVHVLADQSTGITTAGVYIQDLITLYPGVKLLLGGRYNYVHRELSDPITGFDESDDGADFSPRAGIVFQPIPWASFYASYSTAFSPQGVYSSKSGTERFVEPETGVQYEIGIKLNVPSRLTATLAAYHLTRDNVRTKVNGVVSFVGERVSKGIELSLTYQILPGWNALLAYTYTDSQITEDNEFKEGNRPRNVPMNSLRVWSSYTVQNGPLAGLMVGVGMYYAGERYGDKANTFKLPSYTVWDATVSYPLGRYTFALDFSNLFDERYFEAASSRNHVFPGQPFTVRGTVSVTF